MGDCGNWDEYFFGRSRDGRYIGAKYCVYVKTTESVVVAESFLRHGYGKFMLFEPTRDGWLKAVREWTPDDGFTPLCYASLPAGGDYTRWWFIYGRLVAQGRGGTAAVHMEPLAVTQDYRLVEIRETAEKIKKLYRTTFFPGPTQCRDLLPSGRGTALLGQEVPVARRRNGYLRVGQWLAWHRVLGVLDYGAEGAPRRWVIVGDDGLYTAEFVPTAREPLEEFGEVGYVKVTAPYEGDTLDIASPCGAPRLVACSEEGARVAEALLEHARAKVRALGLNADALLPAAWDCSAAAPKPFIIPDLYPVDVDNERVLNWPLADPCPDVVKIASADPSGMFTPDGTAYLDLWPG